MGGVCQGEAGESGMRLSTVGRYALRAMVDLAQHQGQGPVLRKDIAQRQEISSDYLAQLLARLRRAGLVESVLGPGGGYVLARSPYHSRFHCRESEAI